MAQHNRNRPDRSTTERMRDESRLSQIFFGRVLAKFPFIKGIWRDVAIVPGVTAGVLCFSILRFGPNRLAIYLTKRPKTPFQKAYKPSKLEYYGWLTTDTILSLSGAACWSLLFADRDAIIERLENLPNQDDAIDCQQVMNAWNELKQLAKFPIENPLNPSLEAARQFTLNCAKKIGSTDPYWNQDHPIHESTTEACWTDGETKFTDEDIFRKE